MYLLMYCKTLKQSGVLTTISASQILHGDYCDIEFHGNVDNSGHYYIKCCSYCLWSIL